MTHKIPELDGLRAIAILAVLVTHFSHQHVLVGGYLGVDLFFVLSGFLITSLLLSEERGGGVGLGNFYARRALRETSSCFEAFQVRDPLVTGQTSSSSSLVSIER